MQTHRIRILCYSLLLLTLVGCAEDDFTDLNKYIEEVKARPQGAIEALPEIKVVEGFIFKPDGLRDPFQPMEKKASETDDEVAIGSAVKPDFSRRKEELESYPLDTLRMVGTLTINSGLWGLIRANDNTIHRVKVGHYIGQNHGKIIRILEDKIEIMEIVPDKPGMWREQQASLVLAGEKQ